MKQNLPGGLSAVVPPDPMPNSEVKRRSADGSVGSPHARVGNCQRAEVELATLTWVDWYNNRRLLGRLGHTPPAEAEKAYYASIGNNDLAA